MSTQTQGKSQPSLQERELRLGIDGWTYAELFNPDALARLTEQFHHYLADTDPDTSRLFGSYTASHGASLTPVQVSDVLVRTADHLGSFIERLFNLDPKRLAPNAERQRELLIPKARKDVVKRRMLKKYPTADSVRPLTESETKELYTFFDRIGPAIGFPDYELIVTSVALALYDPKDPLLNDADRKAVLDLFERFCATEYYLARTMPPLAIWTLWREPEDMDYEHGLVPTVRPDRGLETELTGPDSRLRRRDGFGLTDLRMNRRQIDFEVDYCIYCHEREKDSCSTGLREKDGTVKKNPLGISLDGCPLEEKISEAHLLKSRGNLIGALAAIMLDNPMCPGTGHRICNDCMKSCIYQKQEPVNIPQIETHILTEVLSLPWGVEIYDLLTRWNPLNTRRPHVLAYNGHDILVVGLGPAGYTLAHYLTNEGFGVVGVDGLKIESLPHEWVGHAQAPPRPIRDVGEINQPLDKRVLAGFGGVSEYGITVRWDKNFLTLIQLSLARRANMRIYGGVRFGGTLTIEDVYGRLGFSHIAIATGAGKPTVLDIKNPLVRGVRMASDFLMALQLTGAFKEDALANLQMRLPAIVIGGGLTATDTATELLAYYPVQVEKALSRYEAIVQASDESTFWNGVKDEDRGILDEFFTHARVIREERQRAEREKRPANIVGLLRQWGGVRIVYRKDLVDSPAYRLNHEEVIKSFEEGVSFVERLSPVEAQRGQYESLNGVVFDKQTKIDGRWKGSGEYVTVPAKTMLVAAGTSPNTIYEREFPSTFELDKWGQYFQSYRLGANGNGSRHLVKAEAGETGFFTSYDRDGRTISFYGDNHPRFSGNVVKAMASAKHGYQEVVSLFEHELKTLDPTAQPAREQKWKSLTERLDDELVARVERVVRLTPTIVDVIVHAPLAARRFHPGQFYRLQNFEKSAPLINGTRFAMEGLALTGAWVDREKGLLSLIVLEMGVSSRLCAFLKPGEPVIVMGPTGAPTEIPRVENVLLAGGGLGNAVLFSIADELKHNGNRVIYFAGYKKANDLFKREEVEESADVVVWATDAEPSITPRRPQDRSYHGNIVQAINAYGRGHFGEPPIPLSTISRVIAIGSDRRMNAVREARHGLLSDLLPHDHVAIGSINSTMQCMMKEICAQCLQMHVDPATGQPVGPVFSCFNQDQPLDSVDFANLNERLKANSALEHISNLWFEHLLAKNPLPHV